jgi:hypothetical protein
MAVPLAAMDPAIAQELRAALLEGAAPVLKPVALVVEGLAAASPSVIIQGWAEASETPPFSVAALQGQALRLKTALERVLVAHAGLSPTSAAAALSPTFLARLHVEQLGGDVLLLEDDSPLLQPGEQPWASLFPAQLWPALLSIFPGATRVARMARVQDGPKRRSQVRLLFPPPPPGAEEREGPGSLGWVTVKENGLAYSFDLTKCMFSSGNVSEKERCVTIIGVCRSNTGT